jgi:hypothetical protein
MRRHLVLLGLILLSPGLRGADADDDPVLPRSIPGYELRSLDVRKPVVFDVNGATVRVLLPVFLYFPTSQPGRREAVRLLRQAYDDAIRLSGRPEWSAADLRRILAAMDASLGLLESRP